MKKAETKSIRTAFCDKWHALSPSGVSFAKDLQGGVVAKVEWVLIFTLKAYMFENDGM